MNSGSSASISSHGQSASTPFPSSCSQASRPSTQSMSPPVLRTTSTFSSVVTSALAAAASTLAFSGMVLPPRTTLVGRNDDVGLAIDDATGQRIRREAAEHDRMHGADARAGQHRDGRLRNHRHVDRDAVALLGAQRFQRIRKPADALMQLAIGDLQVARRIVAFPDNRNIVALSSPGGGRRSCSRRSACRRSTSEYAGRLWRRTRPLTLVNGLIQSMRFGLLGPETFVVRRPNAHTLPRSRLCRSGPRFCQSRNRIDFVYHDALRCFCFICLPRAASLRIPSLCLHQGAAGRSFCHPCRQSQRRGSPRISSTMRSARSISSAVGSKSRVDHLDLRRMNRQHAAESVAAGIAGVA